MRNLHAAKELSIVFAAVAGSVNLAAKLGELEEKREVENSNVLRLNFPGKCLLTMVA